MQKKLDRLARPVGDPRAARPRNPQPVQRFTGSRDSESSLVGRADTRSIPGSESPGGFPTRFEHEVQWGSMLHRSAPTRPKHRTDAARVSLSTAIEARSAIARNRVALGGSSVWRANRPTRCEAGTVARETLKERHLNYKLCRVPSVVGRGSRVNREIGLLFHAAHRCDGSSTGSQRHGW
jgi:hypothetical protein